MACPAARDKYGVTWESGCLCVRGSFESEDLNQLLNRNMTSITVHPLLITIRPQCPTSRGPL